MHLTFRNVNDAFRGLVKVFAGIAQDVAGTYAVPVVRRPSRNGDVLMIDEPVTVTYTHPRERVLFNAARDANPYFHVFETLWMLAGRNDVASVAYYASRMKEYSDDGEVLNGAYGYRWRKAGNWQGHHYPAGESSAAGFRMVKHEVNQLDIIVNHLKSDPTSRRAVLQMWNVEDDLLKAGLKQISELRTVTGASRDVCCNLSVMFSLRDRPDDADGQSFSRRALDMTVTNRSNDLCLSWDTRFRSPEGDVNIQELARRFQTRSGYKYPIYAVDTLTGDQRICWMTNAWKTGMKPTLKLTFDDGSSIRVTADHKLFKKTKKFSGKRCVGLRVEEIEACHLKVGDRVLADIPENAACRAGPYIQYKRNLYSNTNYRNLGDEHRAYYEFVTCESIEGFEIHHRNENGRDNRFENLQKLTRTEHRSHHLKKDNPNRKMTPEQVFERASKGGKTHLGKKFSRSHRQSISKAAKKSQAKRKRDGFGRYTSNHKVVAIEEGGATAVFDFTVPGRHNAVLSNGVLVHNCWGLLGANYVHFTFLQEYLAARLGATVGRYHHFTNNLHVYSWNWKPEEWLASHTEGSYYWGKEEFKPFPLVRNPAAFERELPLFVEDHGGPNWHSGYKLKLPYDQITEPFLRDVAYPMFVAHHWYRKIRAGEKDEGNVQDALSNVAADDWRVAATAWMARRGFGTGEFGGGPGKWDDLAVAPGDRSGS